MALQIIAQKRPLHFEFTTMNKCHFPINIWEFLPSFLWEEAKLRGLWGIFYLVEIDFPLYVIINKM